ncbi:MAG: hypothetical protein LBP56_04400 [Odoribacteraceae bacterium]|jgi:hypothetical protein|nr:hypothetical protein [Odoribacteraceae bacterium]
MNRHSLALIARCNATLTRRGWIFRLFIALVLPIILIAQLLIQSDLSFFPQAGSVISLASSPPFLNAYVFATFQLFPLLFLAGALLHKERKLDSVDSIYYRPAGNAEHVWGTALGIARVFLATALISLAAGAGIHLLASDVPFNPWYYLFYLVAMILPALVFMIGLSFLVTTLARHRAISLLLLLGYLCIMLSRGKGLFDLTGFTLPNAFSDITGLTDGGRFLLQRGYRLLLGLGMIQLTVAWFKRLPNRPARAGTLLPAAALLLAGILAGGTFLLLHQQDKTARAACVAAYTRYAARPKMTLVEQAIDYRQEGHRISVTGRLTLENRTGVPVEEFLLYLNPALEVTALRDDSGPLAFTRDRQVLRVTRNLAAAERCTLDIAYEGGIDERVCYPDIPDDLVRDIPDDPTQGFRVGKRHAVLSRAYTWLTPECLWYPVAVPPANPVVPLDFARDFSRYTLRVARPAGMTVISQGEGVEEGGSVRFHPGQPLAGISLCIGDYTRRAITVDSTLLELYLFRGHEGIVQSLELLADSLSHVLADTKRAVEIGMGTRYPFGRLAVVERPAPVTSYYRAGKNGSELVQPELLFFPERGVGAWQDFARMIKWGQAEMSDATFRARRLKPMLISVLVDAYKMQEDDLLSPGALFPSPGSIANHNLHQLAPLFYYHASSVHAPAHPALDAALNILLQQQMDTDMQPFSHEWNGSNEPETRAIRYLDGHSLQEAMTDDALDPDARVEVLKLKAAELARLFTARGLNEDTIVSFIKKYREARPFTAIPFEEFDNDFTGRYGTGWTGVLSRWYTMNRVPVYLIQDFRTEPVAMEENPSPANAGEKRARVSFDIFNDSDVEGVVTLRAFYLQRVNNASNFSISVIKGATPRIITSGVIDHETRNYVVPPRSGKKIALVLDSPTTVTLSTNISRNIPSSLNAETLPGGATREASRGESPLGRDAFFDPDEVIADDADAGFTVQQPRGRGWLRAWLRKAPEKAYRPTGWPVQHEWSSRINSYAHGLSIRGLVKKVAREGEASVTWKARVTREGEYEVFAFIPVNEQLSTEAATARGPGLVLQVQTTAPARAVEELVQHYSLSTPGGTVDTSVNVLKKEWISLGRYRFTPGEYTVTLDDRGATGQVIVGDAVKWVYSGPSRE